MQQKSCPTFFSHLIRVNFHETFALFGGSRIGIGFLNLNARSEKRKKYQLWVGYFGLFLLHVIQTAISFEISKLEKIIKWITLVIQESAVVESSLILAAAKTTLPETPFSPVNNVLQR